MLTSPGISESRAISQLAFDTLLASLNEASTHVAEHAARVSIDDGVPLFCRLVSLQDNVMKVWTYACLACVLLGVVFGNRLCKKQKITFDVPYATCNVGDNLVISGTKFEYLKVTGRTCAYDPSYYCMGDKAPTDGCPTTSANFTLATCPTAEGTQNCNAMPDPWKCPDLPCSKIIRYCQHQNDSFGTVGATDYPPDWPKKFGPNLEAYTNNPLTITPSSPFKQVSFVVLINWDGPQDNSTVTVRLQLPPTGAHVYRIHTYSLVTGNDRNAAYNKAAFLSRKVNIKNLPCATSMEVLVFQPNKAHSYGVGPLFLLDELELEPCWPCVNADLAQEVPAVVHATGVSDMQSAKDTENWGP